MPEVEEKPPTMTDKPITTTLNAVSDAYEKNVSFDVRDNINTQIQSAQERVSSATDNIAKTASAGVQNLLGINTEGPEEEEQKPQPQQGGGEGVGILPVAANMPPVMGGFHQ